MLFAVLTIAQHALAAPLVLHTNDDADTVRSLVLKHAELRVGEFTVSHVDDFIAAQMPRWQGRGSPGSGAAAPRRPMPLRRICRAPAS